MTYIFQEGYDARLKSWYDLRQSLVEADTLTKCVEIDKWWQRAPLVNSSLRIDDIENWPTPWELLAENEYCEVARGLGMLYTLLLLGTTMVDFVEAKNDNNEEVVLVLVDHAKYVLNYWPDSVVNTSLHGFKITNAIDITPLIKRIGQL